MNNRVNWPAPSLLYNKINIIVKETNSSFTGICAERDEGEQKRTDPRISIYFNLSQLKEFSGKIIN